MAKFIHGTAGWSYRDWVGPFYEPGTPQGRFLAQYAKRFPGAEVDATFYRIPTQKICSGWDRVTPDGFVFSPKLPGEITHKRFLEDSQGLVREFLDALSPLGPKLGLIVSWNARPHATPPLTAARTASTTNPISCPDAAAN